MTMATTIYPRAFCHAGMCSAPHNNKWLCDSCEAAASPQRDPMPAAYVKSERVITDPYCLGSSHAWIVKDYSATVARCLCGKVLLLAADGSWLHHDGKRECPPYNCKCGQRHNVPVAPPVAP